MKRRFTTPVLRNLTTKIILVSFAVLMSVAVPMSSMQNVFADQWDDQINNLQAKAKAYQAEANALRAKADTLQNKLNIINAQKAALEAKIASNNTKLKKLKSEISQNEAKLKESQDVLGEILANLYVDDEITPFEQLASSDSIGDYIDKQEYRSAVRDQLNAIIVEVKEIKVRLDGDKKSVEKVLASLKHQNEELSALQAEQQYLVNKTRGEEAAYQRLLAKNKEKVDQLKAEQAAHFASLNSSGGVSVLPGDPNKGGYPAHLANAYQDSIVDSWGMYNRECVSYTAWKVYQAYGNMPNWGGIGNAWQWSFSGWTYPSGDWRRGQKASYNTGVWHTSNAQNWGIPSGTTPKPGSVAVKDANPAAGDAFGHVAWVENVLSDGKIKISQYNWYNAGGSGWGHYSEMIVSSSMFSRYVYFGES